MSIGVDLQTGASLYEVTLPENTTFWFGTHQLLVCPRGELHASITEGALTAATWKLMLPPSEIQRLVEHKSAGLTATGDLEDGLLAEVTFAFNAAEHPELCASFSGVEEAEDLLFAQHNSLPALFQLDLFTATQIEQVTERIEAAA